MCVDILTLCIFLLKWCSAYLRNVWSALCHAGVTDINKPVRQPLSSVSRQALSDVTPRILCQQALNDVTPRSHNLVSAVTSDTSVGSVSSTSLGRAM